MTQDEEHLKLLSIFHYIVAALMGCFAMFPVIHLIFGLIIVFSPQSFQQHGEKPPAFIGWMFVGFAAVFITLGLTLAVFILIAGRCLAKRKRYMLCLVVAGIECLMMPFGTVLGIFTILVLTRESTKKLFQQKPLL